MSFGSSSGEPLESAIRRNIRAAIEKALASLKDRGHSPDGAEAFEAEAVHEIRKNFKRVRAALRLLRGALGDDAYHAENFGFRDAARPLTQVRDAHVLVETLDKVGPAAEFAPIREALRASEVEVVRRVLHEGHALSAAKGFATQARRRFPARRTRGEGGGPLENGVRRVYRAGRRALAAAERNPTVENLHELRKQAKYMWHVLQLLEPAWKVRDQELTSRAHELSQLLGDDHDLAVLRRTLAVDPARYGGPPALKKLFEKLDARRDDLRQRALALGRQMYSDSPQVFRRRLEGYAKGSSASPGPSTVP